jgi:alkanesulfonate monooxygenase SsuD/methylene tetrahydromethanopterin reductase-like flavin-dependent oxidoreductase (luciferase family)
LLVDVAIGLPITVPGTTGDQVVEWAKRADHAGFSALGTLDRIAYSNYEPLVALSAAAAVTERIGLITSITIAPYRVNPALLAKQAASVQRISGGRLVLGLAAGGRKNDYATSRVDFDSRYERLDEMVPKVKEFWAGSGDASGDPSSQLVGPDVSSDPPKLLIGGYTEVTAKRVAQHADGWVAGGVPPDQFAQIREGVERAWQEAGREGQPYLGGLAYFALGDSAEQDAQRSLGDYYTWLGEETAGAIVGSAAKDAGTVKAYLQGFEQAGCQELIMFPASSEPDQVDLLADAAL